MNNVTKFWLWITLGVFIIFAPVLLVTLTGVHLPDGIATLFNPIMLIAIICAILVLIGVFRIYFFPTAVAKKRNHPQKESIYVLNLCLGWLFIPWVIALVWANTNFEKK